MNAHAQELLSEPLTGIEREYHDVARRIQAEALRRVGTPEESGTRKDVIDCVRDLHRVATRLHRSYENACNREQSYDEKLGERKREGEVMALCHRLGVPVRFCSDPRGAPIQIPCARENANGFAGDCIVIPFGPARDYK